MFSCCCCGLEHILLQPEKDIAWAVGSVSQAHTGQLEEKQLLCLLYGQLARGEMCKGVFDYPMPRCLAQRSSRTASCPFPTICQSLKLIPGEWEGWVSNLFVASPAACDLTFSLQERHVGVGNYVQSQGLQAGWRAIPWKT